jgi:hypothetical protein
MRVQGADLKLPTLYLDVGQLGAGSWLGRFERGEDYGGSHLNEFLALCEKGGIAVVEVDLSGFSR